MNKQRKTECGKPKQKEKIKSGMSYFQVKLHFSETSFRLKGDLPTGKAGI
jgi:hypothetical protein